MRKAKCGIRNAVKILRVTFHVPCSGADAGFLKGGSNVLGLHAKKRGGGPALGPMLKSRHGYNHQCHQYMVVQTI